MIAQQDWIRIEAHVNNNSPYGIVSAGTLIELQRLQDRPESILSVLLETKNYDLLSGTWEAEPCHFIPCINYNKSNKSAMFFSSQMLGLTFVSFGYMGSIENCETLAILEEASQTWPVKLRKASDTGYLRFANASNVQTYVAVDGKYVSVTLDQNTDAITALEVTDVAIPEGTAFVNITEADLMKLIGAPKVN